MISLASTLLILAIKAQDSLLIENVLPIDKVSILPFTLLGRSERLDSKPEKGVIYPTCSSKWDRSIELKTEQAFRMRTPPENATYTFLDYFDLRTERECFAATYYYDKLNQRLVKYPRQGQVFESLDFTDSVSYPLNLDGCSQVHVLPYYEFQSNGLLEGLYCLEGPNLIYLTTTKSKTTEWRRSRISEDDGYPEDLQLLPRFGRVIFNSSYTVGWMHRTPRELSVEEQLQSNSSSRELLLVAFSSALPGLTEKLINLPVPEVEGQDSTAGSTKLHQVKIYPQTYVGSLALFHYSGIQTTDKGSFTFWVDCLIDTTSFVISNCKNLVVVPSSQIVELRSVTNAANIPTGASSKFIFELLLSDKLYQVEYTAVLDSKQVRQITNLKSLQKQHPGAEASGGLNVEAKLKSAGVLELWTQGEKDARRFCFYEIAMRLPGSASVIYVPFYSQTNAWIGRSHAESKYFVEFNPEGAMEFYTPFQQTRVTFDLIKQDAQPKLGDDKLVVSLFYHNETVAKQVAIATTFKFFKQKIDISGQRFNSLPIMVSTSKAAQLNINWLDVDSPRFLVSTNSSSYRLQGVDASRLEYYLPHPSNPQLFLKMNLSYVTGNQDQLFDIKGQVSYNCRVYTTTESGTSKLLCKSETNFSGRYTPPNCQKVLAYHLSERRFVYFCEVLRTDEMLDYCYMMVDIDNQKFNQRCFGTHAAGDNQQVMLLNDDDYTYFFYLEFGTVKGYFRAWTFKQNPFQFTAGQQDVMSFNSFFLENEIDDQGVSQRRIAIGLVRRTSYSVAEANMTHIKTFGVPVPRLKDDPASCFCDLKYNTIYSRKGDIVLFDEDHKTELTLYSDSEDLRFDTMLCLDRLRAVVFWTGKNTLTKYYLIIRSHPDLRKMRNQRQALFQSSSLPLKIHGMNFYVEESYLYLIDVKRGPLMVNLEKPNIIVQWTDDSPENKLQLFLGDPSNPLAQANTTLTLELLTEKAEYVFNNLYAANKNADGEWNITYHPLQGETKGHFWKIEVKGDLDATGKTKITHRFDQFLIAEPDDDPTIGDGPNGMNFNAYSHYELFDCYINSTALVLTKPISQEVLGSFNITGLSIVDMLAVGKRAAKDNYWILLKENVVGSFALRFLTFTMNGEEEDPTADISDRIVSDLDPTNKDFKAYSASNVPVIGYMDLIHHSSLTVMVESCDPLIVFADMFVEYYELVGTQEDSSDSNVYLLYARSDLENLVLKKIDTKNCKVQDLILSGASGQAKYFTTATCQVAKGQLPHFTCVLAGTKVVWFDLVINPETLEASLKAVQEYYPYKNLRAEQVVLNNDPKDGFFAIRGTRLNHHLPHDRGGVMYFHRPSKNTNKYGQGGLLDIDMITLGIGSDYTIALSDNRTLIVDGDDTVLFYRLQDPALEAHSLVDREKKQKLQVYVYGHSVKGLALEEEPEKEAPKRSPHYSRKTVIIAGVAILTALVLLAVSVVAWVRKTAYDSGEPDQPYRKPLEPDLHASNKTSFMRDDLL